jgi:DNA-binding SARP family transcriptional activator
LCITRQTIGFNIASDYWLDVAAFLALKKRLATDSTAYLPTLEQAVTLYHGDFLTGFSAHSSGFEEWVLLKREQLRRLALNAMRRLTDGYEQCGDYKGAQAVALKQLELEPWLEEAHCQLMRALALSGQRSTSLAQYEICRRLLARDLGVEPGDETTALYRAIRDGKLQPATQMYAIAPEKRAQPYYSQTVA